MHALNSRGCGHCRTAQRAYLDHEDVVGFEVTMDDFLVAVEEAEGVQHLLCDLVGVLLGGRGGVCGIFWSQRMVDAVWDVWGLLNAHTQL